MRCNITHYGSVVIEKFRHKGLKRLHEAGDASGVHPDHIKKLRRILAAVDAAASPQELDLPGFGLHSLKGNMKGYWAIMVNGNWRGTFTFNGTNARDVDYLDYH